MEMMYKLKTYHYGHCVQTCCSMHDLVQNFIFKLLQIEQILLKVEKAALLGFWPWRIEIFSNLESCSLLVMTNRMWVAWIANHLYCTHILTPCFTMNAKGQTECISETRGMYSHWWIPTPVSWGEYVKGCVTWNWHFDILLELTITNVENNHTFHQIPLDIDNFTGEFLTDNRIIYNIGWVCKFMTSRQRLAWYVL